LDYKAGEQGAPQPINPSNGEGVWRATAAQTQAAQYAQKLAGNAPGFNSLLRGDQFAPDQYNKEVRSTGGAVT
jgi:hypothetical protein